jgi:Putative transposase of IS4/5 family (DUF4096)
MNVHRSWRWPQETWGADPLTKRPNGVANITRALDPEVVDAVWAVVETLLPVHNQTHPLGCHRPRASDRSCFDAMLVRPVTGCSWEDAARLCGSVVSDTTARGRRDEWVAGGVVEPSPPRPPLPSTSWPGSPSLKQPWTVFCTNPPLVVRERPRSDRSGAKLRWKQSIPTDKFGIPIG